jgi:hypothetical protein
MNTVSQGRPDSGHNAHETEGNDHDSEKSVVLDDPERTPDPERTSEETKTEDDVPPDGGYGWVCTACCFLINAHTWGVNSVCPLHHSFRSGF